MDDIVDKRGRHDVIGRQVLERASEDTMQDMHPVFPVRKTAHIPGGILQEGT